MFRGRGQINRTPGVWQPEWVDADLITYSDSRSMFSVLWREAGDHWRHIIDFRKISPVVPSGGWGLPPAIPR